MELMDLPPTGSALQHYLFKSEFPSLEMAWKWNKSTRIEGGRSLTINSILLVNKIFFNCSRQSCPKAEVYQTEYDFDIDSDIDPRNSGNSCRGSLWNFRGRWRNPMPQSGREWYENTFLIPNVYKNLQFRLGQLAYHQQKTTL